MNLTQRLPIWKVRLGGEALTRGAEALQSPGRSGGAPKALTLVAGFVGMALYGLAHSDHPGFVLVQEVWNVGFVGGLLVTARPRLLGHYLSGAVLAVGVGIAVLVVAALTGNLTVGGP